MEKISKQGKNINYDEFIDLFQQVNLEDADLQAQIRAELLASDHYQIEPSQEIGAYLKQQIGIMVERLKTSSPRNMTPEQVAILKGQGGLILNHLKTLRRTNYQLFTRIIIELAIRTGAHCSRIYLESFSNILTTHHLQKIPKLCLKELVLLKTQKIKNEAFTKYYYYFISNIKQQLDTLDRATFVL